MEFKTLAESLKRKISNRVLRNDINRHHDTKAIKRLSYRELRIIGWLAMVCTGMSMVFIAFSTGSKESPDSYYTAGRVFSSFASLAIPCFLIANFSLIFREEGKFKKLFLKFGGFVLLMFSINIFFLYRYVIQLQVWSGQVKTAEDAFEKLTNVLNAFPQIALSLNLFIDLLLCVCFYFFLTYEPKKHFKGKRVIFFRMFSLLPLLYEFLSLVIRILTITDMEYVIPWWEFPLLCTKPPFLFLSFAALAIYMKYRKKRYLKKGHSEQEYNLYLESEDNIKDFNSFLSIVLLVTVLVDMIAYGGIVTSVGSMINDFEDISIKVLKIGIGTSTGMVFMVPILKFYSYNKETKQTFWEPLIPMIGVILYALAALETVIECLTHI